jgi:anti-anti-sigma factor
VPLSISTQVEGATVRLGVAGEVDLATGPQLRDAIAASLGSDHHGELVVDLGGVTFLDCAGVNALLAGRQLAAGRGIGYRVRNAHGMVHTVLQVTGVLAVLDGRPDG